MSQSRPLGSGYVLLDPLGQGASGRVWRAADHDGNPYAVKVLHEEFTQNLSVVNQFVQERQLLAAIDHPHTVTVHDLVVEGRTLAIVMELVEGPDLRVLLHTRGTLPPGVVATLGAQVAAGLQAAHLRGVVHRDVKPENVLMRAGDPPRAVLTDFGVARLLSQMQQRPTLLGTPQYFAPELVDGSAPTPASDAYALGVTLYELCCGLTPFAGRADVVALMRAHVEELPGRPGGVPDDLWEAIRRMLAKAPRERPTAAAVAAYLDALAPRLLDVPAAPPAAAPPPSAGRSAPPPQVAGSSPAPAVVLPPMSWQPSPAPSRSAHLATWIAAVAVVVAACLFAWVVLHG